MTPTRQKLLDLIEEPDKAFSLPENELYPLRLQAARELFAERIEQLPLLKHRAQEAGITQINSFNDLVPLLFSHTTYKSYPASFVEKAQWQRLLKWLDNLSVEDLSGVDMAGVVDVDDWIDRLWSNDHIVMATSGSSGKCSFMTHTPTDMENKRRHFKYCAAWPYEVANNDRAVFWTGQYEGPNSACEAAQNAEKNWARPGEMHVLAKEPLKISKVSKMAAMRKRMADGSATPDEIAAFEAESKMQAVQGEEEVREFADKVLAHRHEPIYFIGFWAQHLAIIQRAKELGIPDSDFHPRSIIGAGGGVKGVALPDNYKEIVNNFYGDVLRPGMYAMTELCQAMPRCEHDHYHIPPGLIVLLLDEPGEKLLNPAPGAGGIIEGRFAFLDLAYEGRWGGLITGDKVTMDFSPSCQCGRPGPVIHDTIVRYSQLGGDDKITCAGTIEAYINGVVEA